VHILINNAGTGILKDGIQVHILINNAGLIINSYSETDDGFELHMGVNHLGPFLLTNLLLPQMKHGKPARIINLSSVAHLCGAIDLDDLFFKTRPYNYVVRYSNSKLANILFTRQLAKILQGTQIQVFSVHPGGVHTEISRHLFSSFLENYIISIFQKTSIEGAQTTVYCATEAQQHPEMYFSDCAVGWALNASKDEVMAEGLWRLSAQLVGLEQEKIGASVEGLEK
ncbi:NAD(P)-binding domain, partial [Trinorchestia longiramus]